MRVMEIPGFPRKIEIPDLHHFIRTRLSQTLVMWPAQAIPLLGYMCYPNDGEARKDFVLTLRSWPEASEDDPPVIPAKLGRIQQDWLRVADVFHRLCDLAEGRHQARRGGPSIGKAITVVEGIAKSWGTSAASLWKNWSTYKDVAHVVTAATLICAETRIVSRNQPFGPLGLSVNQIIPFQMAMLMPDLLLAVALEFERYGLLVSPGFVTRREARPGRRALQPAERDATCHRIPATTNSLPQASTPLRAGLPLKIQRKNSEDGRLRPAGAATYRDDREAPVIRLQWPSKHCSMAKPKPSPVRL
jgi:hypothetical protein